MDANEIKTKIDAIDDEIAALYLKRMSLESDIVKDAGRDVAATDGSLVDRAISTRRKRTVRVAYTRNPK